MLEIFVRWLIGMVCRLPSPVSRKLLSETGVAVPMRDGVILLAERYYAKKQPLGPVVLMRSPYGRGGIFGIMAKLLAERGFQVVLQSVRGTCGSGGKLDPMRQERTDGADTVNWVRSQPWFTGRLFTFGGSYLGNVQWALASEVGDKIDGLALQMTLSNFRNELLSFGGFTQNGMLSWTETMQLMVDNVPTKKKGLQRPNPHSLDHVHGKLPVGNLDQAAFGKEVSWWQDWVNHADPDDSWWQAIDHSATPALLKAPSTMVAGWQDIFLPYQLRDFEMRQAAGRESWLTIGAWEHASPGGMIEGVRQAIGFFSAVSEGRSGHAARSRVRLFLQRANEWRDYPSWPPPGGRPLQFHLRAAGRLSTLPPADDEGASRYVYDPADPTPSLHGPLVMGGKKIRDMGALERRSDTVLFTAEPFDRDTDVIGPVSVELSIRSDREHTDFYVCLCDVDKTGRSLQVLDGYKRLRPAGPDADVNGVRRIIIDCWPTAYRFKSGHRLRLIVASGAHPRYARNLGTGEPLATAADMVTARQEILHSAVYGSSILMLQAPPKP